MHDMQRKLLDDRWGAGEGRDDAVVRGRVRWPARCRLVDKRDQVWRLCCLYVIDAVMRYIATHWRGEQGLLRSTLVNGILAYVVLTLGLVGLGAALNGVGVYVGLAAFLIWMVWATVGILRCGLRNALHPGGKIIPRVGGLVASIGVCVVLYLAAKDLVHLGFFR
jgi:hypothetical protein